MKKIALIWLLALTAIVATAQCDSSFFENTATPIKDMAVLPDHSIIGVGEFGSIIKSVDGGNSWQKIPSATNGNLYSVQFPSLQVGYISGMQGILKSVDQGRSWFPLLTGSPYINPFPVYSHYFLNDDEGFFGCENGHLLITKDGGHTFKDTIIADGDILSIDFFDSKNGLAAGRGSIHKTTDGGATWTRIDISYIAFSPVLNKIKFLSSTIAVAVGQDGLFIRSTDGGNTWTKHNTPISGTYYDLHFFDTDKGMIIGGYSGGVISYTSDGGNTFDVNYNYPNQTGTLYTAAADPQNGKLFFAGGGIDYSLYGGRTIILSNDKANTWSSLSGNTGSNYGNLAVLDDSTVIIGTGSSMLKTTDYGESWKEMPAVTTINGISAGAWLYSFVNKQEGFAIISDVYKTTDGGKTWELRGRPEPRGYGFAGRVQLKFLDITHGVLSDMGSIISTNDGGMSWTLATIPANNNFFMDCTFTDEGKGFAVGYGGEVQISSDKGTTWQPYNFGTTEFLTSVYFYDNQLGFIGTSDSVIYKTTDGGTSWSKLNSGALNRPVNSFLFTSPDHGYLIAGDIGSSQWICETKDGGQTWSLIRTESNILTKLAGKNTVYYSGQYGLITKTVKQNKPGFPGYINGKNKICIDDNSIYAVPDLGLNYSWSLTGGGIQRAGTNMDTITWNTGGQYVLSLSAVNSCGTGPASELTLEVVDFKPVVTENLGTLEATKGIYYKWYYNGREISEGAADSLSMLVPENTGLYWAEITNDFGCIRMTDTVSYTNVVPMKLLHFSGSLLSNAVVQLGWETAYEKYARFAVLERSTDSLHFSAVDSVAARNNYNTGESYTLTDSKASKGMNFYRLHITQNNRPSVYSNTITVKGSDSIEPLVYPNPAKDILHISKGNENIIAVSILNYQGSIVFQQQYPGSPSVVTINISNLQTGLYVVKVKTVQSEYNVQLMVVK